MRVVIPNVIDSKKNDRPEEVQLEKQPRLPLLQKSELSTIKSLTHQPAGDHLIATLLKQFTTSRQPLRLLAGVYSIHR